MSVYLSLLRDLGRTLGVPRSRLDVPPPARNAGGTRGPNRDFQGRARRLAHLLVSLARAEARGREFIAEAAIVMPVNNQKPAYDLAQAYMAFDSEVASLVASSDEFDERWSLTWSRRPSWFGDHLLKGPFTLGGLSELVRCMALRNRQLGWMLDFLEGGSDEPVRYARAWAKAAASEGVGPGVEGASTGDPLAA